MSTRWVILDRDGVINADSDDYIKSEDEWHPLPGSIEAIAKLTSAGFQIGIATNQSGIARGLYSLETLDKIHTKMKNSVTAAGGKITAIAYCPHGPSDGCRCRKPLPGLLELLAQTHAFSLHHAPFVGDAMRDVEAARAVGAPPILVRSGKGHTTVERYREQLYNVPVFDDLLAASQYLIDRKI